MRLKFVGKQVKAPIKYIPSLRLEHCEVYKYIFWAKINNFGKLRSVVDLVTAVL
jgi:hypothetical protein